MFVVTGVTGQVGGQVADTLLQAGERVRAVVRSAGKGAALAARGCEVVVVPDAADTRALAEALSGSEGVFLLNPPNYDPEPGFPDTGRVAGAYAEAVRTGRPARVVVLSSVGAQVARFSLLNNAGILEESLAGVGVPVAFLRPAWFLENASVDVAGAREGRIESFLQPLDRAIPMVSVHDVGRVAAEMLRESWDGCRVVELTGPRPVSPDDLALAFAAVLGRPVWAVGVPRDAWEARFRGQGMRYPEARIAMLDAFNEGWLDFEGGKAERRVGAVDAATVVAGIIGAV